MVSGHNKEHEGSKALESLKAKVREAEAKHDYAAITRYRAQIARDFPGTADAAEALFRLGLYFLFAEGNPASAIETFKEAIKVKDSHWSKAARVSLASLYLREDKPQQALLELRKVVTGKEPPSIHSISALSIIENVCQDLGDTSGAKQALTDRVAHLQHLVDQARKEDDKAALGYFLLALGFDKVVADGPEKARTVFQEIVQLGDTQVSRQIVAQAQEALKAI